MKNKNNKKIKNSNQMVRQVLAINNFNDANYINFMVGGADCALVAKWLRRSPNK